MGGLRTLRLASLGLMLLQAPAHAADSDLVRDFAVCAGRLSALVEHDWLMMRDPAAAEADRDALVALVAAVVAPGAAAQVMDWRITAKAATGALLRRADLGQDREAAERVADLIAGCRAFIL